MRKLLVAIVIFHFCFIALFAQENRMTHHIRISAGAFVESGDRFQSPGLAASLRYGADFRLNDHFSLMPGLGIRAQKAGLANWGNLGGGYDGLSFGDIVVQLRYRWEDLIIGLGPGLSFTLTNMQYGIEMTGRADSPLLGKPVFAPVDVSIVPSVSTPLGAHWELGVEAVVGLRNMLVNYEGANIGGASTYLNCMSVFLAYRF